MIPFCRSATGHLNPSQAVSWVENPTGALSAARHRRVATVRKPVVSIGLIASPQMVVPRAPPRARGSFSVS